MTANDLVAAVPWAIGAVAMWKLGQVIGLLINEWTDRRRK